MNFSEQRITKSEVVSETGMVTAMHPLAAKAGAAVLSDGGNAADAAVATAFAIGVVEPAFSGIGGTAYAVAHDATRQSTKCFDGTAVAPSGASAGMFPLDPERERAGLYGWPATLNDAAETGGTSVVVPTAISALARLHAWMGSKPWEAVVEPAIHLASEGFPVDEQFFAQTALSESRLRGFPDTMAVFYRRDGTPLVPSLAGENADVLRQPDLARTLRVVAKEGPDSFYKGAIGKEIAAHVAFSGGVLTDEDMASYEARTFDPLLSGYRGLELRLLPGPSGSPTVALALRLLDALDISGLEQSAPERLFLVAEALRLAFAQRFRELGAHLERGEPLEALLSDTVVETLMGRVDRKGRCMSEDALSSGRPRSTHSDAPDQHTTHLNVVDGNGSMVALTATLGGRFGSGVVVPRHGIVLNNGLMWFDPEPGHPQSIAPGKRALHAAAPVLLFEDGNPRGTLGSPGARKIMSAVLQVLLHIADQRLNMQDAIEAPRLHCEVAPRLTLDARFPPTVSRSLRRRGFTTVQQKETFLSAHFARPSGILVRQESGALHGGTEPYRSGAVAGL